MGAKRDLLLNGGAIIPVPEQTAEGSNQRATQAVIWGEVSFDPKPFVENTKKRGQLVKIILAVRLGKHIFQRVHVPQDCPFYYAARALRKGDRVMVCGMYVETDAWTKDKSTGERFPKIDERTGDQKIYREMYVGFLCAELAITDPEEWKRRLHDVPDPFYEAEQLMEEREARQAAERYVNGADYSDETYDIETQRGW